MLGKEPTAVFYPSLSFFMFEEATARHHDLLNMLTDYAKILVEELVYDSRRIDQDVYKFLRTLACSDKSKVFDQMSPVVSVFWNKGYIDEENAPWLKEKIQECHMFQENRVISNALLEHSDQAGIRKKKM